MIVHNGMMLLPTSCVVTHEATGQYEMEMTLPFGNQAQGVLVGELVSLPVPVQNSPAMMLYHQGVPGTPGVPGAQVWRTKTGVDLYLRPKPLGTGIVLKHLPAGTEYAKLRNIYTQWHEAAVADGTVGVVYSPDCEFVRNEADDSSVVRENRVRQQLFRIYEREIDTEAGTAVFRGRHISYDAAGALLDETAELKKPVPNMKMIIEMIKSKVIGTTDVDIRSPRTNRFTVDYRLKNMQQAIMDPDDGLVFKTRAKLVRDNLDYYVLYDLKTDRGVSIRYGKNLRGVKMRLDTSKVATSLVPVGKGKDGKDVLLPAKEVKSSRVYPFKRTARLDVPDAKVSEEMTLSEVHTMLQQEAEKAFEEGADLPEVEMDVDFLALGDTEEYAQYRDLEKLFLYETVTIQSEAHGIDAQSKVIAYEFDCLRLRYNSIRLGNAHAVKASGVASYQLPSGGIQGFKLVPGTVDRPQMATGAVGEMQIGEAEITIAKMKQAAVDELIAGSVTAVEGEFGKITAGTLTSGSIYTGILDAVKARLGTLIAQGLTTDELYAKIATIAVAQMTTLNVDQAAIEWGEIQNLVAQIGVIVNAKMATADIDWAHVKDLVTGTAILTQGVGGEFYFAKLAVTEANMVSLTVGELVVKGADGRFYALGVDENGNVQTTLKQVVNDDISDVVVDENNQVIYGGITAGKLNAQSIFADSAIIRELMAANLDVDVLWAREGFVQKLQLAEVVSEEGVTFTIGSLKDSLSALESESAESKSYIRFGPLINSDGEKQLGITLGEGLTAGADGTVSTAGAMQQITADRQTIRQNGVVTFEVKDGGVHGKKARFDEYYTGQNWVQVETENGSFAILDAGGA